MSLIEAIKAYNKNRKDKAARESLLAIVGNRAVFKPGTKPDAADVDKALDFLNDLETDRAPGGRYKEYQTLAEYEGAGKKGLAADPSVDDVALDPDGVSQDAAEINWSRVSQERRLLVLHGRDIGKITNTPDPEKRAQWASELSNPPNATLPVQWQKVAESLVKLKPSQREALEERLNYKKRSEVSANQARPGVPTPRPFSNLEQAPAVAPPPQVSVPTFAPSTPAPVPSSTVVHDATGMRSNIVKMFILNDGEDEKCVTKLIKHCAHYVQSGQASFIQIANVPAGANRQQWISSQIDASDMVLLICSSDSLADLSLMGWCDYARGARKRLVPIWARPISSLPYGLSSLPQDRPISSYANADEAWVAVSSGLGNIIRSMKK